MARSFPQIVALLLFTHTLYGQLPIIQSIDPVATTVNKFGKFEADINLSGAVFFNPYDFDEVTVQAVFTAPDGDQFTADGFYRQDFEIDPGNGTLHATGKDGFKIRFSPDRPGEWEYQVKVSVQQGTITAEPQRFTCVNTTAGGFVRSNLTNYLQLDNGEPFIPVGENMAWQNGNAHADFTKWLTALADNGGNFIRLWHAHWGLGIEWKDNWNGFSGLRRYKETNMAYQDWLFDFCADRGIYVMLCLQHHGQVSTRVNPNWSENPYNTANGGPCVHTWDFFTDQQARSHTRNRLRYIVARWGYASSLLAWELFNEVGWTDDYADHEAQIADWHAEMAAYLKSIDPYRHLVTTSFSDETQDPMVWANPDIDITLTHYYLNTVKLQSALVNGIRDYLNEFGKPTLTGEFGLGGNSELPNADPDGIHIHNAMWGTLFGGGLGTGMSWWWDNYIHPRDLYYHFAPMSTVAEAVPFLQEDLRPAAARVTGASGDLLLTPTLGWSGIGTDTITIAEDGQTLPADADLGIYLYGSQWNTQFRSPPTFVTHFPEAGAFTVSTNAETGSIPRIAIFINGTKVLDQSAAANQTFTVPVEAGNNVITVDNTGRDWITIASYGFSGLGSKIDAYVLTGGGKTTAAGWVLNTEYNHIQVPAQGQPDPVTGGVLHIAAIEPGGYTVHWFDCLSGIPTGSEWVFSSAGGLEIPIPPLYWDLAFTVEQSPLSTRKTEPSLAFRVYPNPVTAGGKLKVSGKKEDGVGERGKLALYDATGKPLKLTERVVGPSTLEMELPPDLPAGLYWLQLRKDGKTGSRPVLITR